MRGGAAAERAVGWRRIARRAHGPAVLGPPPGSSFWQVVWAAWKLGEFGSSPLLGVNFSWIPPPGPLAGSGKFVMPWLRMQAENFSAEASALACWAGLGGPPGLSSFPHLAWAASNCGDWGLMPLLGVITVAPLPFGSGKFGTPLERMHAEYLMPAPAAPWIETAATLPLLPPLLVENEALPPAGLGVALFEAFVAEGVVESLATEDPDEPHAARSSGTATSEAAIAPRRRSVVGLPGAAVVGVRRVLKICLPLLSLAARPSAD
jgi:hypothetical protein